MANCRQGPGRGLGQDEDQDKGQDEAKFKISVGMSVMNCVDNTDAKKLFHDDREGHRRPLEQDHSDED